jgi:hypothetical protein
MRLRQDDSIECWCVAVGEVGMNSLLEQDAPGLTKKLQSLSLERRRKILASACLSASISLNSKDDEILAILKALKTRWELNRDEIMQATRRAEIADSRYLERQSVGSGEQERLDLFSEARLMTAISIGFGGTSPKDTSDAIYELCKTCDDPSEIIRSVESDVDAALK